MSREEANERRKNALYNIMWLKSYKFVFFHWFYLVIPFFCSQKTLSCQKIEIKFEIGTMPTWNAQHDLHQFVTVVLSISWDDFLIGLFSRSTISIHCQRILSIYYSVLIFGSTVCPIFPNEKKLALTELMPLESTLFTHSWRYRSRDSLEAVLCWYFWKQELILNSEQVSVQITPFTVL